MDFQGACLDGAMIRQAQLPGAAFFNGTSLRGAVFKRSSLNEADFSDAFLQGATLVDAKIKGARFFKSHLEGANLNYAVVDGETLIAECWIDRNTMLKNVGLASARIDWELRQSLEYNIRRKTWEEWYGRTSRWEWPFKKAVQAFWWMSDYGHDTWQVVKSFLLLSFLFAVVYYTCGFVWSPGPVANLFRTCRTPVPGWLVPFRAVYFSVVTMTTLGFGDMHANSESLLGHLLLALQVLLGYLLLGALVCRMAIVFQAGGFSSPAPRTEPKAALRRAILAVGFIGICVGLHCLERWLST